MKISTVIRMWREASGRSLAHVGEEIGISKTAMHRIEAGKPVSEFVWSMVLRWLMSPGSPAVGPVAKDPTPKLIRARQYRAEAREGLLPVLAPPPEIRRANIEFLKSRKH